MKRRLKMSQPQSTTLDGLPKRFVYAMRKLFDIMDDKKTGYVKFSGEFNDSFGDFKPTFNEL